MVVICLKVDGVIKGSILFDESLSVLLFFEFRFIREIYYFNSLIFLF